MDGRQSSAFDKIAGILCEVLQRCDGEGLDRDTAIDF